MEDRLLIEQLKRFKRVHHYTLHDLSKLFDIHVTTIERWLKTARINRVYAQLLKEKLKIENDV